MGPDLRAAKEPGNNRPRGHNPQRPPPPGGKADPKVPRDRNRPASSRASRALARETVTILLCTAPRSMDGSPFAGGGSEWVRIAKVRTCLPARRTIGFQPVATQRTSNTNRDPGPKPASRQRVRDHSPESPTHHRQWNPVGQPGHDVPVGPVRGQALSQIQFTRAAPFPPRGKSLHCWTPPAHTGRLIHISQNTTVDNIFRCDFRLRTYLSNFNILRIPSTYAATASRAPVH
jgi:hypothetical protein